ncbi:DUF421 domain-containing protein [Siminovitchia acidinfaciens]|uniref:DUF421 domain-containing protein n=1 Tax=Siminovitchia acidinfaciens TaxID=2321395 RepID=A0A429Y4A9_9BACI|nr:YetF domain-containing protein [Siminovitchia acidinfaciens]RST76265.1 DUF421 domain-containing protein [Siminovitchia acidinfaciens]
MDFFNSQESLTAIQWVLRAVLAYLFMLVIAKAMGQRSISQLRLLDFVISLIIGNIIAHPLSDEKLGMKGTMITMSVLVLLYTTSVFTSLKINRLRKFIDPPSFPLIENGQIKYKNLKKAKISLDYLLCETRKEKIDDVQKVALALWEPDGTISFFLEQKYQTVTKEDMQIIGDKFSLSRTIVKEGKIDINELKQLNKDEVWLRNKIESTYRVDISDILLATMDRNEQLKVLFY